MEGENQEIERYTKHLEKYEQTLIVRAALSKKSTFGGEVKDFYGLIPQRDIWRRPTLFKDDFEVREEDPLKSKTVPTELVEILNEFREEDFDINLLGYDSVRTDRERWTTLWRRTKYNVLYFGETLSPAIALVEGALLGLTNNWDLAVPAFATGIYSFKKSFSGPKFSEPEGTNNEIWEYVDLDSAAKNADYFMDRHYRDHFIRKTLEKSV